ncbi:SDR family NAD(P)-dependent oxidoreductase [Spongiibacter tropicus]|uniref:SDR family NAD(P)-dependent oxidoreductase n=1 Tax=Spongiibacter tropicus TaxID=454602 RepID=UPI0003B6CCEA|nr:SDR family NAD(P)-dependent oxidoreductase [Spongiibacter tropicus]
MKHTLFERIRVNRPVVDCFNYLRDFSTIPQWDPGVFSAEKLTPGPVRARAAEHSGTEYQLVFHIPKRKLQMRYEQLEAEPNKRLVLSGYSLPLCGNGESSKPGALSAYDEICFDALSPELTEISYRAELTLHGIPDTLLPAFKPALNRLGKKVAKGISDALSPKAHPDATPSLFATLKDRLIVPALPNFGRRGYQQMPDKSLSQRMDGKRVVLTGPTAGLGLSAACELARLGATLILIGRNRERMAQCRQHILDTSGADANTVFCYEADLSSLAESRRAADAILAEHSHIDVLINNAGALFSEREETPEGHERALAVNLLSPTLLCRKLASAMNEHSRVINVVSGGMYLVGLREHDMEYRQSPYDGSRAYAHAKRALFTYGQELNAGGVTPVYAMHPGWAATPGVAKSLPSFNRRLAAMLRDSRMGADTIVWLASCASLPPSNALWFDRRAHTANVLPGTAASARQRQRLLNYLDNTLQAYL